MANGNNSAPRRYLGVMISSTFTDLKDHRAALINAINGQELKPVVMEYDSAKPGVDVVDSSLNMVRDASAYIGLISRKYGQAPEDPVRNPDNRSITELEFDEAQKLGRPILLFIMGADHPLREADVETDHGKREKLNVFRERAKLMKPGSLVHRVYTTFNSLEEFKEKASQSVAELRRYLDVQGVSATKPESAVASEAPPRDVIPAPPAFYAEPPYIGSHQFVGRRSELDVLSDWASPADAHPVLVFDAIGGSGKSMLTWEWITNHAIDGRKNWEGRFWYSFYERGAVMADFCRRALAYMTGAPLDSFKKMRTAELGDRLLHQLRDRPWLFVLDGLERVLVAYNRIDAAELPDEAANAPTDQIADRDPCGAIRPEDDDLLRKLAGAVPSKMLISSRLVPRVLLNPAAQPIQGVLRVALPGLRPADAEALFRSCGITGNSQAIQDYLKSHCDCHPLVTGILAGLVNSYLPDRGNFDAWENDPEGGGKLDLANLDLVQKRNHILRAALAALPEKSRQLLSMLALLSEAIDFGALSALNPYVPPEPKKVNEPLDPKRTPGWATFSDAGKDEARQAYDTASHGRREYERAIKGRLESPEFLAGRRKLANAIGDLERRGLLQYDTESKRYDLHPVVRGIAAGTLRPEEKDAYGQRVVDYFSSQAHNPYEDAETIDDLRDGLHVARTLLKVRRYQEAYDAYIGDFSNALLFNLEANAEVLSLLRPFFPDGWGALPRTVDVAGRCNLANLAGLALSMAGEHEASLAAHGAATAGDLSAGDWSDARTDLTNISIAFWRRNRLAKQDRWNALALDIAILTGGAESIFVARLSRFWSLSRTGRWDEAQAIWNVLDPMGRTWKRAKYRPGEAEHAYAWFRFWQGDLSEEHLGHAERLAKDGKNRGIIRDLHALRGEWRLKTDDWSLAAESLLEAVKMARAIGETNPTAESLLALAQFRLGQLEDPRREAEQLSNASQISYRELADLWLAIGDREQAKKYALAAYKWAWADGEPYVHRYELNRSRALLEQLDVEIPDLPPYDPAKDEKLLFEDDVVAAIEKLRAKKQAESMKRGESQSTESPGDIQ